jgi:hypothetical protein
MKVRLISCESGDWDVLEVDGEVYHEGHSIPDSVWLQLVEMLGAETETEVISDEAMEMSEY